MIFNVFVYEVKLLAVLCSFAVRLDRDVAYSVHLGHNACAIPVQRYDGTAILTYVATYFVRLRNFVCIYVLLYAFQQFERVQSFCSKELRILSRKRSIMFMIHVLSIHGRFRFRFAFALFVHSFWPLFLLVSIRHTSRSSWKRFCAERWLVYLCA